MTCKDQIKILDDKIESNINQYKVDRLNADISAFSSSDLNKYEFLTRKDLKYKPNALDKTRFQFYPLGQTFSIGLDKTTQGYQEVGVMKLLKDIRDVLVDGVNRRPNDNRPDDAFDNRPDDGFDNRPDDKFDNRPDDGFDNRPDDRFDDGSDDDGSDDDGSFDDGSDDDVSDNIEKEYNSLLLKHFQLRKNMKETKDELDKIKDDTSKKLYNSHGFDIDSKHKDTNDTYDPNGFDIDGKHKVTKNKYDLNGFDIDSKHKVTKNKYDSHGFDIDSKHKDTNDEYDPNGFDIYYTHKDTDYVYDPNGFNINGLHKVTKNKYDPNGFDINGLHKDTKTKHDFNGFDINGLHKDTKTKYNSNGFDINGLHKDTKTNLHKDKIKTEEAKSFKDQKGNGYVDLPILLSKLNINSSKELVSNVKQLVKNLYDNKQITKQVYNILNKAITYK